MAAPDEYEWSPRAPNRRERMVAALLVAALLIAGASKLAGWRIFGAYDKEVAVAAALVTAIVITRLMPTALPR